MPMIDIYLPAATLGEAAQAELADLLATTLLKWEGAPDTDFFRSITWVYVHEAAVLVGGRAGGEPRFRIEVTVPEGALSTRRKSGLINDVHRAVVDAAGLADTQALHVWTLVHEIPEGNWGAAGEPVQFSALLELSAAERADTVGVGQ